MKCIVPALVLLMAALSAVRSAAALENPAVVALREAAGRELRAGRPDQASALLERALQIEPYNAAVWQDLSATRLAQGEPAQAEAMAAKSRALSPAVAPRGSFATLLEQARARVGGRSQAARRDDDRYAEQVRRQRAARQGRGESNSAPEIDESERRRPRPNPRVRLEI